MPQIRTRFTLADGRTLTCEYSIHVSPGSFHYPEEVETGSPVYWLGNKEVRVSQLPKGLAVIAAQLYEAEDGSEYSYKELDEEPFYDEECYTDFRYAVNY